MRERIEEESERKSDGLRTLSKAQAETQLWRSKFETEGLGRVDELEGSKAKITARLAEAEETIDSLNSKVASTEKTKYRLEAELEDLQMEYERVHAAAVVTEKRGRNFDKVKVIRFLYLFIFQNFKTCCFYDYNYFIQRCPYTGCRRMESKGRRFGARSGGKPKGMQKL